ncbi:GAP family protein [Streptomyces lunaelactis]|uniref:GAP family protein n=1 Tax=Streptomyces lunaelactis TaxID=1535768 RepID=UPI001585A083|nr:GAP family protein [Streptomyces lunaelactis]NUL02001.1 GAP family protein [Streptomyces lunaelactis]
MTLDLILIGLAITLEPFPVMAFIVVLSAHKGVRKGVAFILSWLACLVLVIACVLLFTGGTPPKAHSAPSTASLAVKLAIGVGLIAYGVYRRRRTDRPRRDRASPAKGDVSAWTAAGLAVLLQPWGLVAAGATTVMKADLSQAASWLTLMLYCVLATSSLLAMELYATFRPGAAQARLDSLRTWMTDHQDQAIVTLSLLLGFWLVGRSIYELV